MPEPGSPVAADPSSARLRPHPLRARLRCGRRHRHDRSARGAQRPRPADPDRAGDRLPAGVVGRVGRRRGRHRCRRPGLLHRRRPRRAGAHGRTRPGSTGAGWAPSSRCTTGCGTSASRRSPASTAPASAAATSSRSRATCRSSSTTRYIRHVGPEHGSVPGRRRDPVAAAHRRRPARARDHHAVRADPAGPGARVGARLARRSARASSTPPSPSWPRSSRGSCPRRCATRRRSSTGGATSSGPRPSSTRATGWRSTPRPTRRGRPSPPSTTSGVRASPSCAVSRPGEGRTCPSCGALGLPAIASVLRCVRRGAARRMERT